MQHLGQRFMRWGAVMRLELPTGQVDLTGLSAWGTQDHGVCQPAAWLDMHAVAVHIA